MKWYKNPLQLFTLGLLIFALGALAFNLRLPVWLLVGSVTLGGALGYFIVKKVQPRGHMLSNTIVTIIIATLLLNPALRIGWEPVIWTFLGGLLVVLAKLGPHYKRQIIFNPAAFGLLILSLLLVLIYGGEALLPTFVSWWGTDYLAPYPLLLLIPLVLYGAYKFRKLYLLGAFLLFNALIIGFTDGVSELYYPYTSGMLYFMAGVMILEPKTSPTKPFWQVMAALAGVLAYRYLAEFGFRDVELWAIIAVNLVHLLSRLPVVKSIGNLNLKHAKS